MSRTKGAIPVVEAAIEKLSQEVAAATLERRVMDPHDSAKERMLRRREGRAYEYALELLRRVAKTLPAPSRDTASSEPGT